MFYNVLSDEEVAYLIQMLVQTMRRCLNMCFDQLEVFGWDNSNFGGQLCKTVQVQVSICVLIVKYNPPKLTEIT